MLLKPLLIIALLHQYNQEENGYLSIPISAPAGLSCKTAGTKVAHIATVPK